jgi:hypothetical protein
MASRFRTMGRVMAVGLLALLMSACIKLDMNLEVSSNDTVSGTVIFAVQKSLLDLTGQSFDDLLGSSAPLPEDVEGVTVSDYEDDQYRGQKFTFDAVTLADFSGENPGELAITHDGDVFHVSGTLDLTSVGATGATGLSGLDPTEILQSADLRIRLTFPGEVTDSNGQVDGNTVTWVPVFGESTELRATAQASGGGSSSMTLLLIIGAAVVVLAVAAGVIVAQRRNRPAVAAAGPGMDGGFPAPGSPPSSAPTPPAPGGPASPPPPPPGPADQG